MKDIPHFDLPFAFTGPGGHVNCIEQDTVNDVAVCVEAICRTRPMTRLEIDDFGIPDPAFLAGGAEPDVLLRLIADQEPRVTALIEEDWDFVTYAQELALHISEEDPYGD